MLAAVTLIAASGSDRSTVGVSDREARIALRLKIAGQIEAEVGAPDDVPAGESLRILAKREPTVEMLVALTFIAASTPIVPPLKLLIVKLVSLCVASWPLRLNTTLALPPMVPRVLSRSRHQERRVEMLFAATLITASTPIVLARRRCRSFGSSSSRRPSW